MAMTTCHSEEERAIFMEHAGQILPTDTASCEDCPDGRAKPWIRDDGESPPTIVGWACPACGEQWMFLDGYEQIIDAPTRKVSPIVVNMGPHNVTTRALSL